VASNSCKLNVEYREPNPNEIYTCTYTGVTITRVRGARNDGAGVGIGGSVMVVVKVVGGR